MHTGHPQLPGRAFLRIPTVLALFFVLLCPRGTRAEGPEVGGFLSSKLVPLFGTKNSFQDSLEFRNKLYLKASASPDERLKLLLSGRFEYNAFLKGDGTGDYGHVADIHEGYASLSVKDIDLSLGQKKVSWGKADLSIVDNINPPDLTELLFIEEEFAKVPVPMAKADYYVGPMKVEGVVLPFYTPARFTLTGRNWSLISPQLQDFFAGCAAQQIGGPLPPGSVTSLGLIEYPKDDVLSSSSLGARVSGSREGLDFGMSWLYGWEPLPTFYFNPDFLRQIRKERGDLFDKLCSVSALDLAAFYPLFDAKPRRITHIGAEFATTAHDVGIRAEADLGERRGLITDNLEVVEKPVLQWTVGADYTLPYDIYVNGQFLQMIILNYQSDIFIFKEVNNTIVGYIRRPFYEDKIQPELRGLYNITQGDFYAALRIAYQWTDALRITGALNVMGGPPRKSFLGFFSDNSHASLQLRYSF